MSRVTPAYAAGLLDGEGCVGCDRNRTIEIRIDIGMTKKALPILKRMEAEYGGKVRKVREATDRWEEAHCWNVNGQEAAVFLRLVEPFVILKEEQVRLALEIQELRDSQPQTATGREQWSEEAMARSLEMADRIKELNRKGPSPKTRGGTDIPIAWRAAGKWRSMQGSLLADLHSEEFSGTFPKWGSMSGGVLFERRTPEPRIVANVFSSLLMRDAPPGTTPRGKMFSTPDTAPEAPNSGSNRRSHPSGLGNQAVALYPTPTVDDEGNPYGRTSGALASLATEVIVAEYGAVEKDPTNPLTRMG